MRSMSIVVTLAMASSLAGCSMLGGVIPSGSKKAPSESPDSAGPAARTAPAYVDPGPYEGPVHERRAGQVVFSKAPIPMDATDDSAAFTSWTLGTPLYIRYFAAESPRNLMPSCERPKNVLRVSVNGESAGDAPSYWNSLGLYAVENLDERGVASLSNELELAFTTPSVWTPDREVAGLSVVRVFNSEVIPKLVEGNNELHIIITMMCSAASDKDPIVAEGKLTITVPKGGVATYLSKFGTRLGKSPHPENKALVPKIIKAMGEKPDWDNEHLLGASVISEEWLPVRNKYSGRITELQVEAALIVRAKKEPSEHACRLFRMGFAKDPKGGPLRYAWTGQSTPFPCGNTPK